MKLETEALIDENKRLREHLAECADRFERCCVAGGSDKEYAEQAVKKYRDALGSDFNTTAETVKAEGPPVPGRAITKPSPASSLSETADD